MIQSVQQAPAKNIKKRSATEQEVQPLIDDFAHAVEMIPDKKNEGTHEKALSHAREIYTKMYKFSEKHPFVFTEKQRLKFDKALKKFKSSLSQLKPDRTKKVTNPGIKTNTPKKVAQPEAPKKPEIKKSHNVQAHKKSVQKPR